MKSCASLVDRSNESRKTAVPRLFPGSHTTKSLRSMPAMPHTKLTSTYLRHQSRCEPQHVGNGRRRRQWHAQPYARVDGGGVVRATLEVAEPVEHVLGLEPLLFG